MEEGSRSLNKGEILFLTEEEASSNAPKEVERRGTLDIDCLRMLSQLLLFDLLEG